MNLFTILKMLVEINLVIFVNISKISVVFCFLFFCCCCFVLYLKQEGGLLETNTTNYVIYREEN